MQKFKTQSLVLVLSLFAVVLLSYIKVNAANAPALKEGSYLTGQTLSVWPSWSLLGNSLGVTLPSDPINQLATAGTCAITTGRFCVKDSNCPAAPGTTTPEKCILHDPETGWSIADRRFTFACSKDSYAYRYIVSTTPGAYTVRARLEDTGLSPTNNNSFISSFVSTSIIRINDSSGVCNFDEEISSMQSGVCGDGKLNLGKGEQCDPPGRIEYANGCVGSTKNLKVCNSSCQWVASTTLCSNLSKCGNGSIEFGETCDDGGANGKYNKCNINCTGRNTENCGDGVLQSAYEVCDPGTPGIERWGKSRSLSCSWDCQNWGPYCGDALVQNQYGEECDGSAACSVDGNPGVKACEGNCLKIDWDATAWWRFEQLITPTQTVDASANSNAANCVLATCPKPGVGKYGKSLAFTHNSGEPRFFTVNHSSSLTPTTSLTVEAWIYPINTSSFYQRVIEKGGPSTGKGYGLEFNISTGGAAATPTVRFNLWNATQTSVDSRSPISLNTWTHVVGTYERNGSTNIGKIYINGVLENTVSVERTSPIMAAPDLGNLSIGRAVVAGNYFFGNLDEVKIYNRVLSADSVRNNYQTGWFCTATSTPITVTAPGTCGDNTINNNEVCDRGANNNGRACVPTYGSPCSYCSADCQNTIDVQPLQYCGNGIIESTERCEVAADGLIYSGASTTGWTLATKNITHNGFQELVCANETPVIPHTIKKGTKSCADCGAGVVRDCVKCGVDVNGVSVGGNLINVLDNPRINPSPDPLFARQIPNSSLSLAIGKCPTRFHQSLDRSTWPAEEAVWLSECYNPIPTNNTSPVVARITKTSVSADLKSYSLLNPYVSGNPAALLSSNPVCSVGDAFQDKYTMFINNDWNKPLNFPVIAQPQSWQYDLVLSPVVSQSLRAKDLRVVVSWVGAGDFYSGVLNPFASTTQNENPQIEGPSYIPCTPGFLCYPFVYQYANGTSYYSAPANYKKFGVWYHGFNSTPGQTSAEAFTVDTSAMSGNTYSFYVRAPSFPIRTFKNTAKLKVDVYLPENDTSRYHFGTPIRTYYFLSASPSDNQNARYWQVFNVNEPTAGITASDIIDVNAIATGPAYFRYTNPLIAKPACTINDWQPSYTYSSGSGSFAELDCFAPDTKTTSWSKKATSNCAGGLSQPATVTETCPPVPVLVITCTNANWQSAVVPTPCPVGGGVQRTRVWTRIGGPCTGGVQHPPTEVFMCPSGPIFNPGPGENALE